VRLGRVSATEKFLDVVVPFPLVGEG
jgi:hypothetical protein